MKDEKVQELAELIRAYIRANFETVHLSGNLMDTITVEKTADGFTVEIPAEIYDLKRWKKEKAIVYTGEGSYAEKVNQTGGFSGKHANYVEDEIEIAIIDWGRDNNMQLVKEEA